ncbi:TlyA family RNA methyltransferase [Thiohalorhabdus sp.]|uniref:TlyA family RNA methyltransferase n=1 Tax=Thiohalorhabdus sp. TaxID=3094134 RepID=UPI002FC31289
MTIRIDTLLVQGGFAASRARARRLVEAGAVSVDGRQVTKPGREVPDDAGVTVTEADIPYVSRAGLKLEAALDTLGLDPTGARAIDVGAATGGFTDCLLQRGAHQVVTVDVGTDQLHSRLRREGSIRCLEATDIRRIDPAVLAPPFDWLVADLSFIALGPVLPRLRGLVVPGSVVLVLVKPQFELGPKQVGSGGVVRDADARQAALDKVRDQAATAGFRPRTAMEVPIPGEAGNREYCLRLEPEGSEAIR